MNNNNICRFLPKNEKNSDINILNFVHETKKQEFNSLRCEAVYKMHLAVKGCGRLHILGKIFDIEPGDMFFTFPGMSYAIESLADFEYMYISFLGIRTNEIMDKLDISKNNFIFRDMSELFSVWQDSIIDNKSLLHLRCEGILLYSFSMLGEKEVETADKTNETIMSIKKYIDENFSDRNLSVEKISQEFSYNPKYVSGIFKKKFRIGISQYIKTLRIQKACMLMEQGFTSVKDISFQCGFTDQFYFSKVFKDKMNESPKEHMLSLKKSKKS